MDAITAAKAIQDRHRGFDRRATVSDEHATCSDCGRGVLAATLWTSTDATDAGVVLARLNEAITHLEAIVGFWEGHTSRSKEHAVAALACLRNEKRADAEQV